MKRMPRRILPFFSEFFRTSARVSPGADEMGNLGSFIGQKFDIPGPFVPSAGRFW
jgi:hypothetical protein